MVHNKKIFLKVITFFCFLATIGLGTLTAQSNPQQTTLGKYVLYYGNKTTDSSSMGTMLNNYFEAFNTIFHFNKEGPGFPYIVRICDDIGEFNSFIVEKTGKEPEKGSPTLLKYSNPEKSEVVFIAGTASIDIARHLFVQYLYSYVKEPPAWLLGGYSLYAETISWSKEQGFYSNQKNNLWISQAKKLQSSPDTALTAKKIMNATKNDYETSVLYPQAWLLINYLEQSSNQILNRLLIEGITELRLSTKDAYTSVQEQQNIDIFTSYMDTWSSWEILEKDFKNYIDSLHTPTELLKQGIDLYSKNTFDSAYDIFMKVLDIEPDNSTAIYYVGLTAYNQAQYAEAEKWFKQALDKGADTALINWALGANAYSDKRFDDALNYLNTAKKLSPDTYTNRVDELLKTIPTTK